MPSSNHESSHYWIKTSINGLLPSQRRKLWVPACEASSESTWHCCYPPTPEKHFPLCFMHTPVSFCGFSETINIARSKLPFPKREERKALIPFILSSLSPMMLGKEKPPVARSAVLISLYVCAPVCIHTYAHECDCACKSMCDNIIQMPHHTVGLCQSHPMKHTEQMLIVKS